MVSLLSLDCPTSYTQTRVETLSLSFSMRCASNRSSQDKNDTIPSTIRWTDGTNEQDLAADVEMYGR